MKLKKWLSLFFVLAMCLSLVGCAHDTSPVDTGNTTITASDEAKQLVDAALQLAVGESLPDEVTLTGVVTAVKEVSESHGNATFDLQVESSTGSVALYCYRVKPAAGTALAVAQGDTLTLTGTIVNYKGTIEFYPATYRGVGGAVAITTTTTTTRPKGDDSASIDEDGAYTTKEDVALYLHVYGRLPKNFVTKSQYSSLGKPAEMCCGGDRFQNREGRLPNKAGRQYYECDIDTMGRSSRGAKRIVYSNDGLIYYTGDHYETFTLLYGEP